MNLNRCHSLTRVSQVAQWQKIHLLVLCTAVLLCRACLMYCGAPVSCLLKVLRCSRVVLVFCTAVLLCRACLLYCGVPVCACLLYCGAPVMFVLCTSVLPCCLFYVLLCSCVVCLMYCGAPVSCLSYVLWCSCVVCLMYCGSPVSCLS